MTKQLFTLFERLPRPEQTGRFSVISVPSQHACYVGRDSSGCAAVLIRTTDSSTRVPLILAGIEARFSIGCRIEVRDGDARTENLTVVTCRTQDRALERYFFATMEALGSALGPRPTVRTVAEFVDRLVDLFQKLAKPPRRPLVGLVGELLVIRAAADLTAAIRAWRVDQDERYDFSLGNLRVDAKATTSERRCHEVSFEQANPPPGTTGILASFIVQPSSGGLSLGDLLSDIEGRIEAHDLILKLRTVVADTLGRDMHLGLSWAFDLPRATSSAKMFDVSAIPALRPPLPAGVSGVRFVVDLVGCSEFSRSRVEELANAERALLPP